MQPPSLPNSSWNEALLDLSFSPVTPSTSDTPTFSQSTVVPLQHRLRSSLKLCPTWYFCGYHLHPARWYSKFRRAAASAVAQPNDHFVTFATPDDVRISVARPLLEASGGPLSMLAGARHDLASVHSIVLYDDFSLAFTTVSRFIACYPVDLSPRIAPIVALTAIRWHIHSLATACFASFELFRIFPLHPDQDGPDNCSLPWPAALALWMPLLDPFSSIDIETLPPRFATLLSRRIALTLFEILPLLQNCRRCTTKQFSLGTHSSCMFCASLSTKSQGFWYILWHHGMLHDVLHIAVEIGGHTIATAVASVIIVRLRQVISEESAIALLCSTECPGGWSHVMSKSQKEQPNFADMWDARAWRIMAYVLAHHISLSTTSDLTLGSVHAHIRQVSHHCDDSRHGICVKGEPWGTWEVHLAVARCGTRFYDSAVHDDDVLAHRALRACVRLKNAADVENGEEYDLGRLDVVTVLYAAGCACEYGCALERVPQINSPQDRAAVVSTDLRTLQTRGLIVTLLDYKQIKIWSATHRSDCGLFVTVQIRTPGLVPRNSQTTACVRTKWYQTCPWSKKINPGRESCMENANMMREEVCSCSKCSNCEL